MSWVDPRYISVDNDGILTFLAPSAAATAVPEKEKKPKEKRTAGVPALSTVVNRYFRDWTGGTPADLIRRIQFLVAKGPKTLTGEPAKVVDRLKAFIENHFADANKRGKQKNDEWYESYVAPSVQKIKNHMSGFLEKDDEWDKLLVFKPVDPKPRKKRAQKKEESSEDDPFAYFTKIVKDYTTDIQFWPDLSKQAWETNYTADSSNIFKIMNLLAQIIAIDKDVEDNEEPREQAKLLYPDILNHITSIKTHIEYLKTEEIDDKEDQEWKKIFESADFNNQIDALSVWVKAEIRQYNE